MKAINCIIFLLLVTLKSQAQNVMTSSPYLCLVSENWNPDFTDKMQLWVVFPTGCEIIH